MKIRFQYIMIIAACVALASCKKDNYDAPSSTLSGRIVYKGEAIGVEVYQVPYELYQYGFGKVGGINSSFTQEGNYSAVLFDGDYKLTIPNGQGPFMWKALPSGAPDSIAIALKGSQTLDLEVTPYYMIRTPQIAAAGGVATATFKAEKIITDAINGKNIERVTLYLNKTAFVSAGDNSIAAKDLSGAAIVDPNNISISLAIPTVSPTQNYMFARIGLKIAGVEDMIFSPIKKLTY